VREDAQVLGGQLGVKEGERCAQGARITEWTGGKQGFEDHDWSAKENPISREKEGKERGLCGVIRK
jgi:hypothetical protein